MLNNNSMLNPILNVPRDDTMDGVIIFKIPSRGLPNGLCMTYQDINHTVVMSIWFDKVRVGGTSGGFVWMCSTYWFSQSPTRGQQQWNSISRSVLGWLRILSTTR
jgi:hypothetical protein